MRVLRAPLVNVPKVKKPPKPIPKVSAKGRAKKQAMAHALIQYFERHGWAYFDFDGETRAALCQLCSLDLHQHSADFHHRQRASQAGSNGPENGLALHRLCHSFLHAHRDVEDAALEQGCNLVNGLTVKLSDQRRLDLYRYLGFGHTS